MIQTYDLLELNRIEKGITHLDIDKELRDADSYRFATKNGKIIKVPRNWDGPGSFLTGTSAELIYSNETAGTARNTFTVEGVQNDVAGMGPQPVLPPYFFLPGPQSKGKTFRVVARGIYSTTGAPTFTATVRLGAAASTSASIIGGTGAIVHGTTQTNLLWEIAFDCQLTIPGGTGANSTVRGLGFYSCGLTALTVGGGQIFGNAASPGTVATIDISITNYINVNAACGTSSASNIFQCLQVLVFGWN